MNKIELLDLKVYGKDMETHIEAKSAMIGEWVAANCKRSYGEPTIVAAGQSVIKHFGDEKRVQFFHTSVFDTRFNNDTLYGYMAASNRGTNFMEEFQIYGARAVPNHSLFMIPELTQGVHLVIPRYAGKESVAKYVQSMREEAAHVFKTFLQPGNRRVRMYVEEWKND